MKWKINYNLRNSGTPSSTAAKTTQKITKQQNLLKKYKEAKDSLNTAKELFKIASKEDNEYLEILYEESNDLEQIIRSLEINVMLTEKLDDKDAIITVRAGAGGKEAQDWASIIYRMYVRWAQRVGFKIEILDCQNAVDVGIKDVSFIIKGENAYGYLKVENGIHRLKRVSPYGSNLKRHTSFASVIVSPQIDDDISISIKDKDIRIDTFRSSGKGGQHVNTTDSAVRITHNPTGIVVSCQNDRSQHNNKATALKMLKSRLYEYEKEQKKQDQEGNQKPQNSWGHQIRSYTMQPGQLVKDNRSNKSYTNVEEVLDGDINKILEEVIVSQKK